MSGVAREKKGGKVGVAKTATGKWMAVARSQEQSPE